MRKEVQNWLQQAEDDFNGAKYNYQGGIFYIAAFFCQQAVEKALKSLFLHEKNGEVPQSHSLIYLATNTSLPKEHYTFLRDLTPKFIDTRYPDAAIDLPSRLYDKENTIILIEKSEKVLSWIRQKMNKK